MHRSLKKVLFVSICWLIFLSEGSAQSFSYVYIQGDKQTPIYVKVEGEMMPRYGKNYALISRLAPGSINIEILFQQNIFPPLKFTILVPESGSRSFLINKKGTAFALYDLQQNFYLQPGNDVADDHLPSVINNATLALSKNALTKQKGDDAGDAVSEERNPQRTDISVPITQQDKNNKTAPTFIGDIELSHNTGVGEELRSNPSTGSSNDSIVNSDCPTAINDAAFQRLYTAISRKKTEEERLGFFLENKKNCYTLEMIIQVAKAMESDAARYAVLKTSYPKVTNQSHYPELEWLFSTDEWKEHFKEIFQ